MILLMQLYPLLSLGYTCSLFGKSRQGWYSCQKAIVADGLQDTLVLKLVDEIRANLPRCGTDKLHFMLRDSFASHGIKMGRDLLYTLLGEHGLLVRYRRRKPYTTDSYHRYKKYPNLIREMHLTAAGQLWVSDITYLRLVVGFCYLSIITDAYSHKIVGYKLHSTLQRQGPIDALLMACKETKKDKALIHHSDRGVQYCCDEYVAMIEKMGIQLSMTERGDPYENAIAERINGILKDEFSLGETSANVSVASRMVDDAVYKYNHIRIHDSCNRLTPIVAHEQTGVLQKLWKNKVYPTKKTVPTVQEVAHILPAKQGDGSFTEG